jgi:N-acyl-D-amino-acid deacylase
LGTYVGRSFDWEQAAVHLASRTAARFGLTDRGTLRAGAAADISIIDPLTVADTATYDDPRAPAHGILDVFVNGMPVLRDGALTGALAGRGLRRAAVAAGIHSPSPTQRKQGTP